MRLKEDSSSWRAEGLKAKVMPLPDEPQYKAKKDTRHWCKGKVGREHDYQLTKAVVYWKWYGGEMAKVEWRCSFCSKSLRQLLRRDA